MQMMEGLGTKFKTSTWGIIGFLVYKTIIYLNGFEERRLRWVIIKMKKEFDSVNYKKTFKNLIFEKSSAKISPKVKEIFIQTQPRKKEFLQKVPIGKIYIDGHTDNEPVPYPITDFQRYGAVYDDNYTLSPAQAREARNILVGNLDEELSRYIIVAGYYSSIPLDPKNPAADINRRVEIRFVVEYN